MPGDDHDPFNDTIDIVMERASSVGRKPPEQLGPEDTIPHDPGQAELEAQGYIHIGETEAVLLEGDKSTEVTAEVWAGASGTVYRYGLLLSDTPRFLTKD